LELTLLPLCSPDKTVPVNVNIWKRKKEKRKEQTKKERKKSPEP